MLAAVSLSTDCRADAAPPPTATQSARMAPSAQDPTAPPDRAPGEAAPFRTPPPPSSGTAAPETKQGEASTGETVELPARPFAYIEGKADRDGIYAAILGSLGVVKRDLDKAGIKPAGRPLAVFVESDDSGFRYHAGYPLETLPQGGLSDAEKLGQTPSGKAMRFEHLGSYADIDATYDAITAYLDEKGIDAQDSFVEEYANDVKDPDEPTLQVNIYVLLK
ncbi:MAG TPA: GyrI-like domain-containing protein [Roseiarcus sp.]|nr:GyrI-like domain-containing protein [Roseiarcus sp.]